MKHVVAVAMATVAAFGLFGSGSAAADLDYSGLTYAQASEKIAGWGGTAVISTVVGDQLATSDCMVTGSRTAGFLNSSGTAEKRGSMLLSLNCNAPVAAAGKPGNSAASPEGKDAKISLARIGRWNAKPESCSNAGYCQRTCAKYGGCSDEFLQYIGG